MRRAGARPYCLPPVDADANRYLAHRHPAVRAFAPCAAGVGSDAGADAAQRVDGHAEEVGRVRPSRARAVMPRAAPSAACAVPRLSITSA